MFKPTLAGWAATRRSRQLILRLFPAICALLLLIGLSGYLLVQNALNQDRDVQQRSRTFISRTLDQVRNEVGRNIITTPSGARPTNTCIWWWTNRGRTNSATSARCLTSCTATTACW